MNFFTGQAAEEHGAHTIGVWPEHLTVSKSDGTWKGTADIAEHLGSDTYVQIDLGERGVALARFIGNFGIEFGISFSLHRTARRYTVSMRRELFLNTLL